MSREIGIICSIIISILAYLMNNVFIDLDINIGASTLALIFGALSANLVPNIEKESLRHGKENLTRNNYLTAPKVSPLTKFF